MQVVSDVPAAKMLNAINIAIEEIADFVAQCLDRSSTSYLIVNPNVVDSLAVLCYNIGNGNEVEFIGHAATEYRRRFFEYEHDGDIVYGGEG